MSSETTLTRLSATELAARIRNEDVTATEAVEAHLERIEDRDDEVNAFVTVCAEEAREAAAEADRALKNGTDVGPLHGVPVALKDLGDLKAGVRHTFGSALFADHVAERTAVTVERLEAAGAIVIGKTNTPAFGHKGTTDNEVAGPTASPIDTDLNAGGSSGGSAAALAAGMASLATGSDAGGSLRIPAAACGVYGFKPTFGLVPDDGRPNAFGRSTHTVTKGPMARTVEDAALLLSVMAGPDAADPRSVPIDLEPLEAVDRPASDLEIAYSLDLGAFSVDDEVRAVVDDAVDAFEAAGATVDEVTVDHGYEMAELREAVMPTFTTAMVETATVLKESQGVDLREHPDDVSDSLLAMLEAGEAYDSTDLAKTAIVRTDVFDAVQDVLESYDVLVAPTLSSVGVGLHEDPGVEAWDRALTWPFNWTGHPVASAPAGLTDRGHPVGLQLVGSRFDDETVLAASAAFERQRPWHRLYTEG
ncbi:amidase [Natronobacterium gregoryi]|uniref:Amidase n=2 Tax=Natronobacterium gregoryi TaxID=44930 RepID=L0AMP4_NATGS|nr:amidase [Natronobacterium gregoryi]AFZ74729.1 amidase, Asp-tRNAAsn/Glu-tRNAGln amidotransferase A subunit [Natronobacterium gregoryi SP2]ELY73464.1 amidase [Natronobacterium gregoryi SP2]PLK20972.1 amidase [Natronobacterium gregoryi SP2]SFJ03911.1 aspartyl-tRNA(Asn)/glutamyl-tRNA(Gln) amidotransferase subunit A [Natronobacterium gregoryi]